MLLQVDPATFGLNLHLIVGALLLLIVGSVLFFLGWTLLRAWRAEKKQRESWEAHQRELLAPDGKPYPSFIEGVCGKCGRGDHRIYHPESGEQLCPACYDAFCRRRVASKRPLPPVT
jgi:hypothetical protein